MLKLFQASFSSFQLAFVQQLSKPTLDGHGFLRPFSLPPTHYQLPRQRTLGQQQINHCDPRMPPPPLQIAAEFFIILSFFDLTLWGSSLHGASHEGVGDFGRAIFGEPDAKIVFCLPAPLFFIVLIAFS